MSKRSWRDDENDLLLQAPQTAVTADSSTDEPIPALKNIGADAPFIPAPSFAVSADRLCQVNVDDRAPFT